MSEHVAASANSPDKGRAPGATEKRPDTVRVRVRYGRLLVRREKQDELSGLVDVYAKAGEVVEVSRRWAEKAAARKMDGYPPVGPTGAPGEMLGIIRDPPIEILAN